LFDGYGACKPAQQREKRNLFRRETMLTIRVNCSAPSAPSNTPAQAPSLFDVGRNCCALAHSNRIALLVDGEAYFSAFARAAERAVHSILVAAWDFNSSACLRVEPSTGHEPPTRLGDFLNWLVRRRRELKVHVLDWDYPMLYGTDREIPPIYGLGWKPHRRVQVTYDNTHPVGGSHHQKIVVIDDAMAFVGGFDLTARRWDTSDHCAEHLGRVSGDSPYPPFHDLMMAVDGDAADVLAGIVRARWLAATHEALAPVSSGGDPWPPALQPDLTDVRVAVARTLPNGQGRPEVCEVEALYLDMIACARRHIYIENQYFTSHRLGEALAARLSEPDGPEIVLVTRLLSHGWLEEHTMHVLRDRLIRRLREADCRRRFHVYYAHIDGLKDGTCIDVHSKLMIVDDEIVRVGSANFCNRSMGVDSECDVAIEARGDLRIAATVRNFRNRLLGEHLDVPAPRVDAEVQQRGSLHDAIEALRGRARTLKPLDDVPEWSDTVVDIASVADPERPVSLDELVAELRPEVPASGALSVGGKLLTLALVLVALAGAWRYSPLAGLLSVDRVTRWADEFAHSPWAPFVVLLAYTPACLVMFPRPIITLGAVIAFGPWLGFGYALAGIMLSALLTYLAGRQLPRDIVRKLGGVRLNKVMEALGRRGLLAMTALRLVPLAPFAVVNLAAGAIHIKLWHFMLGTLFGMLPGTLVATVFGGELEAALRNPSQISYGLLAGAIGAAVALSLVVRRWLLRNQRWESMRHGKPGTNAC
jgi:phospholipase D1/2